VNDNILYARVVRLIGTLWGYLLFYFILGIIFLYSFFILVNFDFYSCLGSREGAIERFYDAIVKIINDEDKARLVVRAGQSSAGYEISEYDMRLIQKYVVFV
jgi:hypothetical protein